MGSATIGDVFYGTGLKARILRAWRRWLFNRLDSSAGYCTGGGCCSYCPHVLLAEAKESYAREALV